MDKRVLEIKNERAIAAAYDGWSRTYESMENATRDLAAEMLRGQKYLNLDGRAVLEIGCGTGLNTRYLAEQADSVTAIDFSEGMLARARENVRAANVKFQRGDIKERWNVTDESVDVVIETLVLEHIEDLGHVFREAARVLRPGGEFVIYELHPYRQLHGGQAQFKNAHGELEFVPAFSHTVSEFINAALQAGFYLVELREEGVEDDLGGMELPRIMSLHVCKK